MLLTRILLNNNNNAYLNQLGTQYILILVV